MRGAKASFLLGIFFLLCCSSLSYAQKLSEEDALEGSANLMSPDDEDFNEHSGELPPEENDTHKASTFKPHFVTQPNNVNEIIKETVPTESPTITDITSRPAQDAEGLDSNHTMILIAIGIIVTVLILLVLVIVCCRKKKTDYTQGTPRV